MSGDNATLAAENEDLRAKLGRAYQENTKLRTAYKELVEDWHLLLKGKRQRDSKLGAIAEKHSQEMERIKAQYQHQYILTAIFSAVGGFGACVIIVWALVTFVWG